MRAWFRIFAAIAIASLAMTAPVRAEDAAPAAPASPAAVTPDPAAPPPAAAAAPDTKPVAPAGTEAVAPVDTCEAPAYLLTSEAALTHAAEAIKARRLDILVVGSASSVLAGPDGASASYPARLEAALRDKLSGVVVNVSTAPQLKKTAAETVPGLGALVKERKPSLVVWQTGTADAVRSVDVDEFRAALDTGIAALVAAGSDVVLMNLQYSPRMETMISVTPYVDNMRVAAEEAGVPLFDRFAMMSYWNESGRFDLFNPGRGLGLAKQVHECLGQTLAAFVINATHLSDEELPIQR